LIQICWICGITASNQLNTHNSLQHGGTTDATLVQNNFQPSTMMIQGKPDTFLDVDIKNETLYNDRGNSTSTSNCNLKLSGNILSSPAQVLSNMPLLYVNNVDGRQEHEGVEVEYINGGLFFNFIC
jgi:hypothetical protein